MLLTDTALFFFNCLSSGENGEGNSRFLVGAPSEVLLDFSLTVKAAPHECVIRTSQP